MPTTTDIRPFSKGILRQPDWIAAFAISGLIVWLHFYFLMHAGGFWRDEVNLINLAERNSLNEMSKDSFPVLMPLLVRAWSAIGFGRTEIGLRLLGTLIGLGIPAALWLAAWKIKRSPPLLGLALLAFNSTVIMFGNSLRAYGLGALFIILTTAAMCLFLQNPTWRRAAILAALAILSVQSLFQNAVLIAAICAGGWAVCLRQRNFQAALKIFTAAVLSASSLLPYWSRFIALPDAAAALRNEFEPMYALINVDNALGFPWEQYTWVWLFFALAAVACGGMTWREPEQKSAHADGNHAAEDFFIPSRTTLLVGLAIVPGLLWFAALPTWRWYFWPLMAGVIVWLDSRPQKKSGAGLLPLFAGAALLIAFTGFAGFLWLASLITEPWYFIPLMGLAAVCFEAGLPLRRHARAALLGFVITTTAIAFPAARSDLNWRFTNLDLIARELEAKAAPDDLIVVAPWYYGITFDRYFKGATPWNTLPPLRDHSTHRYDLVREQMQTPGALRPVLDQMTEALQANHRVWFVTAGITIPKPGVPMPEDLPPPPLPNSIWSDRPYNRKWISQANQFLASNSRQFQMAYFTTNQNVNFSESPQLYLAEGWKKGRPDSTDSKKNSP